MPCTVRDPMTNTDPPGSAAMVELRAGDVLAGKYELVQPLAGTKLAELDCVHRSALDLDEAFAREVLAI